ncbi:hypothetical protein Golob_017522 [Gossypium lobatum]|uniref:Uncharacterized protein n=1 Tax=Gossypium lobatum TaxID=34289 RepID=A0A7J8M7F4_9ROSI|nr:hypothetical protein [Gossypium lobatum]
MHVGTALLPVEPAVSWNSKHSATAHLDLRVGRKIPTNAIALVPETIIS